MNEYHSWLVWELCIKLRNLLGAVVEVNSGLPSAVLCRIVLPLDLVEAFAFLINLGVNDLLYLPL